MCVDPGQGKRDIEVLLDSVISTVTTELMQVGIKDELTIMTSIRC